MLKVESDSSLRPSQLRNHNSLCFIQVSLKLVLSNLNISPRVLTDRDLLEVTQKMGVAIGSEDLETCAEHWDTSQVTASDE